MESLVRPNPFWSDNAQANWELQQARPRDLPANVEEIVSELPPVPGGDEDPDLVTSGRGRDNENYIDGAKENQGFCNS